MTTKELRIQKDNQQWDEYMRAMDDWYLQQGLDHEPTPDWDTRWVENHDSDFADGRSIYTVS